MGHKKIDKKKVHGLVFRAEFIHLLRAIEQFGSVSIHSVVLEIQIRVNLNYLPVFIRYYDYHFLAMQNANECKFAHRKKVTIDCSNPNDRTSFGYSQQLYVNETKWNRNRKMFNRWNKDPQLFPLHNERTTIVCLRVPSKSISHICLYLARGKKGCEIF